MTKIIVKPINYTEIEEHDVVLFLKPSFGRIFNCGGADYILTINRSSPEYEYTYNPLEFKKENPLENKIYNGNLFQLGREFNLFKVENLNFQETREYLKQTYDNLSVLPQFHDDIKNLIKTKTDISSKIQQVLSEPLSSVIFCNLINENIHLLHKLHFGKCDYNVYFPKLIKLEYSLKLILGVE